ncbi:MAG TPA: hypothetical protein VEC08_00870 [Nitrososphaerales archaeon]|nr:hypothetical protein [Nitrososphaerales archaeon]
MESPRIRKSKMGEAFGKATTYFILLFYIALAGYYLSNFRFSVLALGTILSFAVLLSIFEVLSVKKTATKVQVRIALLRFAFLFGILAIDTLTAFQGASYVELSLGILPILVSYELIHRRLVIPISIQKAQP